MAEDVGPERIRFYIDEHVPKAVARGLRDRGISVLTVPEAGLLGRSDEWQLNFARKASRVLFTQDADFLRLHASGAEHAGIVYASQQTNIGEIVRGLTLVCGLLNPEDMEGHVEFL